MGKPSKADYHGHQPGEAADAMSLHTTPGTPAESSLPNYRDQHDRDAPELDGDGLDGLDDLPPLYSEAVEASSSAPLLPAPAPNPTSPLRYPPFKTDTTTGDVAYLEPALESPGELEHLIRELATTPPRPQMCIVGTHSETRRKSDGKSTSNTETESVTVVDFSITIEMAPYLYSDAQHRRSWTQLRTIDNDDKAHRGTLFAGRAPGAQQQPHLEVGGPQKPSLEEWCHRFCASHAGLKCFTLRRRMTGFDLPRVKEQLRALVRSTNYRGSVSIGLKMRDARVDVYNDALANRWRLTRWIRLLFFCTFLFLFAWPYLWLCTRRWEVAVADWPFSRVEEDDDGTGQPRYRRRYVALSEDQWYNMWARAIHRAVLGRRQKTLDQEDLRDAAAVAEEPSFESAAGSGAGDGIFRAGINAMNQMNIQMGWGGDREVSSFI